MSQYLLSTWTVEDEAPEEPPSPDRMQATMQRVMDLEAEMDSAGAFMFGGGLYGPDAATVVRATDGDAILTDGPFAESKEHIAGFYVIDATDLDDAVKWAGKVSATIGRPIEVRPFRATGRVADHMPGA